MPKVQTFSCEVITGDVGTTSEIYLAFNGHPVQLKHAMGGTAPSETYAGDFDPMSVAHSLTLLGPESGQWQVEAIAMTFEMEDGASHSARFGPVTLDGDTQVSIWAEPPRPTFDV